MLQIKREIILYRFMALKKPEFYRVVSSFNIRNPKSASANNTFA